MAEARPRKLVCITRLASLATVVATLGATVVARADGSATNLDDNLSGWRIWWDCGGCAGSGQINPDPGEDGSGMDIDFQGGASYVGMYNYYPLPADPSANTFQVNYDFIFFDWDQPNIQALEFTMNQFVAGERYEWALQWEQIGVDGAPQWRIWDGNHWQPFGMPFSIQSDVWHSIQINGHIGGGQAVYDSFTFDGVRTSLGQGYDPHSWPYGDQMLPAIQLDGNSSARPYHLYVDNVNFYWWTQ